MSFLSWTVFDILTCGHQMVLYLTTVSIITRCAPRHEYLPQHNAMSLTQLSLPLTGSTKKSDILQKHCHLLNQWSTLAIGLFTCLPESDVFKQNALERDKTFKDLNRVDTPSIDYSILISSVDDDYIY